MSSGVSSSTERPPTTRPRRVVDEVVLGAVGVARADPRGQVGGVGEGEHVVVVAEEGLPLLAVLAPARRPEGDQVPVGEREGDGDDVLGHGWPPGLLRGDHVRRHPRGDGVTRPFGDADPRGSRCDGRRTWQAAARAVAADARGAIHRGRRVRPRGPATSRWPIPTGGPRRCAMATYAVGPEGPDAGPTVLLLHGEPTWSYLYRHVLDALAGGGRARRRGRPRRASGAPTSPRRSADHTYARHVAWVREAVFDALGLDDLVAARAGLGRADRAAAGGRGAGPLPGGGRREHRAARPATSTCPSPGGAFRRAVERAETLDVGRLVASGCARGLAPAARAAYDAPFPDEASKAGPRAMPLLVPTRPDDPETEANRAAWAALARLDRPFVVAFSDSDPITGSMAPVLRDHVPRCGRRRRRGPRPRRAARRGAFPAGGRRVGAGVGRRGRGPADHPIV